MSKGTNTNRRVRRQAQRQPKHIQRPTTHIIPPARQEQWKRDLWANPNVSAEKKVLLYALTFWYLPQTERREDGFFGIAFEELAEMTGMDVEEIKEHIIDLHKAGLFSMPDDQQIITTYECENGHTWSEVYKPDKEKQP